MPFDAFRKLQTPSDPRLQLAPAPPRCSEGCQGWVVVGCYPDPTIHQKQLGHVHDRLPSDVREQLADIQWPSKEDFQTDKFDAARKGIRSFIACREILTPDVFHQPLTSACSMHGTRCQVNSVSQHNNGMSPGWLTQIWAGIICLDYTQFGNCEGIAGKWSQVNAIFGCERAAKKEAVIAVECAPQAPIKDMILDGLSETHTYHDNIICPTTYGFPVKRKRRWVIATRDDRIVMQMSFEDFAMHFRRSLMVKGTVFYCADEEKVQQALENQIKSARKKAVKDTDRFSAALFGEAPSWYDTLSVTQKERLRRAIEINLHRALARNCAAGDFIVDLDHNADEVGRMSKNEYAMVPCLITHGVMWKQSIATDEVSRPMLDEEYFACQGMGTLPQHGTMTICPFLDLLNTMQSKHVKFVAGNGMHAAVVTMLLLWLMSCGEVVVGLRNGSEHISDLFEEEEGAPLTPISGPAPSKFRRMA